MNNAHLKPAVKFVRCPICGDALVVRKSQYGRFMGCRNFAISNCRFTMPIPQYILEFIKINSLNIYGWYKTCWNCGKKTFAYTYNPHYDLCVLGEEIVFNTLLEPALGEVPKLDQYMMTRFPNKIKIKYSQTRDDSYAANVCQHCHRIR